MARRDGARVGARLVVVLSVGWGGWSITNNMFNGDNSSVVLVDTLGVVFGLSVFLFPI